MNTVRTLPIRVAPLPGESIDSWLEAIAHRSETAWGDLLTAVALTSPDNRSNTWIVQLDDAEAAALGAAAGTAPAVVHAMTLSHYANRAVAIDVANGRFLRTFPWGRARGSRYCPHCLADNGGRWQLAWRLGWAFACTQHRCLLADVCPTCHGAQRHRTHITTAIPRPGSCANPAIGQTGSAPARCGTKLADASVVRFDDDHPLLAAQRTVYDVIERGVGAFGVYVTAPQPRRTVLADIRAVAGRILAYAAPEELAQAVPVDLLSAYRTVPAHPSPRFGRLYAEDKPGLAAPARAETAAVGVVAAMGILGARDIDSAGDEMRWLVTGARMQGLAVSATTLGRGSGKSDTLYAVQLSALAPLLAPGDQLRYRIGTSMPRRPTRERARLDRLARRTPTMLWPAWSLRLATAECNQKQLRPALSTALLFVETRVRLREAAGLLACPLHEQSVLAVLRKLSRSQHWDHIRQALTCLADYLAATDTLIDYQRRRQLDYTELLSPAEWARICRDTDTAGGTAARAKNVRFYLFERLSGMPAAVAAPGTVGNDEALKRAADFPRHLTPELNKALHDHASDFLRKKGVTDEPAFWHPPTALMDSFTLPSPDPAALAIPVLHSMIRRRRLTLSAAASQLDTTLDDVRYVLESHPAPANVTTPRRPQTRLVYGAAKTMLPREKLIQLYEGEGRSLRDIAASIGVSRQTIGRLATEYNIALREAHRQPTYDIDATWLYEQYVTKHRSLDDLAAECGMSVANMARWARVHCIPVRRLSRYTPHELAADTGIPPILRPALSGVGGWERLQRFAEASRYRTLQAAAQDLGLNQFTLVDQVNRIERDLGRPILVRANAGRPMQLTPVGFQVVAAIAVMAGRINEGASESSWSCSPRSVPGLAGPRSTVHTGSL